MLKQRLFSNTLTKEERSQSQPKSKVLNISVQCATAITWAAGEELSSSGTAFLELEMLLI